MHRSMDQRICQWERLAHLKTRHCSLGFWTQEKVKICTVPDRPSLRTVWKLCLISRGHGADVAPRPNFPLDGEQPCPTFSSVCALCRSVDRACSQHGFGLWRQNAVAAPSLWIEDVDRNFPTSTIFLPAGAGLFLLETSMLGGSLCIAGLERFGPPGLLSSM